MPRGTKSSVGTILSAKLTSIPCLLGLVHVGDELREVNGITVLHKRPDEISQILVCVACLQGGVCVCVFKDPEQGASQSQGFLPLLPCLCEDGAGKMVSSLPASLSLSVLLFSMAVLFFTPAPLLENPFKSLA